MDQSVHQILQADAASFDLIGDRAGLPELLFRELTHIQFEEERNLQTELKGAIQVSSSVRSCEKLSGKIGASQSPASTGQCLDNPILVTRDSEDHPEIIGHLVQRQFKKSANCIEAGDHFRRGQAVEVVNEDNKPFA